MAGKVAVDHVSFDVHRGEICPSPGSRATVRPSFTEAILGLTRPLTGSITLDGAELTGDTVKSRLHGGLGFVPEDRSTDGIIGSFSIAENLVLDVYDTERFSKGPVMYPSKVLANATTLTQEYDVRLTSVTDPISTLSGGNQQKVVVARAMSKDLRLLVASQPTRGLDVGSIEFIHRRIVEERDKGIPCVIVSTELDEVLNLADRIAVMYRGRIVGIVPGNTSRDVLGLMMAGVPLEEAEAQAAVQHTTMGVLDEEAAEEQAQAEAAPDEEGISERTDRHPAHRSRGRGTQGPQRVAGQDILSGSWLVSILAVVIVVLGAILIAFADPRVQETAGYFFARPTDFFAAVWDKVSSAYSALFRGAIFDWQANTAVRSIRPLTESLVNATPLILTGLAVAIPFRAGMLNIGGQGQVVLGALTAGWLGYAIALPPVLHVTVALIGGAVGGALYAGIAGFLKARTGANEVIVTIMLNNIAAYLILYLLKQQWFTRTGSPLPQSSPISADTASLPLLLQPPFRLRRFIIPSWRRSSSGG